MSNQNWSIPNEKLVDGYGLALKNAKKLLGRAKQDFDDGDYGLCIFHATIAMEELGKGIMFMEHMERGEDISLQTWNRDFLHHKPKILASVNHIRTFVEDDDPKKDEKLEKLNELENYLIGHLNQKLESLYLGWDSQKADWAFFDEQTIDQKKSEASLVLSNAEWLITGYLLDGKIITERKSVILDMLRNGKAYGFCSECDRKMNYDELATHKFQHSNHKVDLREN